MTCSQAAEVSQGGPNRNLAEDQIMSLPCRQKDADKLIKTKSEEAVREKDYDGGGEETFSASAGHCLLVFGLVPPPRNNIHGCMAAFFGKKQRKQKIRNWRNIKTKFLGRILANSKHKTSHVLFNTEIVLLKDN